MSHAETMKGHLIAQFVDRPVITAFIDSVGEEMELIESAYKDLAERRWIDTGEGVQLDGIGEIVDRDRVIAKSLQLSFFAFQGQPNALGFEVGRFKDAWESELASTTLDDPEYRLLLWHKVFKNSSICTTEETIRSLSYIFNCNHVFINEIGDAKVVVGIGRRLTPSDIAMASAVDLMIRAGGVGMEWREYFDYDNYFGFAGQQNAKGFDEGSFADFF